MLLLNIPELAMPFTIDGQLGAALEWSIQELLCNA